MEYYLSCTLHSFHCRILTDSSTQGMETKKPTVAGKKYYYFTKLLTIPLRVTFYLMFVFIGVFTGTVLETTGERIWGSMWRVESVSTLHTRVKLNCVKWVSLLFEINKNMSIAFSIFDFYTPIHMLCHIASYICFIITIVTPIFFYFQNSILMSSKAVSYTHLTLPTTPYV